MITSKSQASSDSNRLLEHRLFDAAQKASRLLQPKSLGVFVRKPLLDEDCPEVSDVDLISLWEEPEECPERITVEGPLGRVFVDILWVPVSKMIDSLESASYKILPHLLLEYETLWIRSDAVRPLIDNIKLTTYEKNVWERRISHQINFGDAALQEARKNLDFPLAALFFLQTAHAYYITALADCLKHSTMSLLTRPVTKLRRLAAETRCDLEQPLKANLHLDVDPSPSLVALHRIYNCVTARCGDRRLQGVTRRTRGHYAYTISPLELEFREMVAKALIEKEDNANANFYIRFWAYSLSRCPVVLEDGRRGRKPSFYVPFDAFKESINAACPEILDDMITVLGGEMTPREAEESIEGTAEFRQVVTDQIRAKDYT